MTTNISMEIEEKYIGSVINERYKIIRKIGVGGMGNVYFAEHEILKKKVAIKILHFEQSKRKDTLERFKREAIAASNMGQANIVDVTDFGYTEEGNAYFVMEYIEGNSLAEVIKNEKRLPLEYAVSVACQISVALYSAHSKGIIHRDLKPENILITEKDGVTPFVKIVDFGISKIVHDEINKKDRPKTLTKSGSIFGTPEYMSPEQAGGNNVEPTSDIYSLGVIIYEMLTGRIPFSDDNYMKVLHKHQYEFPQIPSSLNPSIPSDMDSLIMKCLEKKPFNRYESMLSLLSDLKKIYIAHNLEKKLSLAFIFNTGTVSGQSGRANAEEGLSGQDIIRLLNSGSMTDDTTPEEKRTGTALKITAFLFLSILAGFLIYSFIVNKKGPMIVERETVDRDELEKEQVKDDPPPQKKKPEPVIRKKPPTIKLIVNSNVKGVRVYDKDKGKTICTAPCTKRLPKKDGDVLLLGFEFEDYNIKPMAITLDKDMTVNLNLTTSGGE
ncbi:MAG TPA: serine/threonine-protein kinase [bacterium]|nr:serine/threonine-protein kinase [bacterium]